LVIPSSLQSSETIVSLFPIAACAILTCVLVNKNLAPTFRPLVLAAARPYFVRSLIKSL